MNDINYFDRLDQKQIALLEKKQELKIESTNSFLRIKITDDEAMIEQHRMPVFIEQIEQPVLKFASSLAPIHKLKFTTSSN